MCKKKPSLQEEAESARGSPVCNEWKPTESARATMAEGGGRIGRDGSRRTGGHVLLPAPPCPSLPLLEPHDIA